MDKKDIYEHLAEIYLNASSKKKKKSRKQRGFRSYFLATSILAIFLLAGSIFLNLRSRNTLLRSETALALSLSATKINFNFDPAKKETFSVNLNNLNLSPFRALGFSVKKATREGKICLRVEFTNNFNEKSEVYFRDIPNNWQDYNVDFSKFKNINDWTEMKTISFAIEEWNATEKKGVVYVDHIRFLR